MRKMKESGIEWIGEIPEDWSVTRLGSLYYLRNIKVSDSDFQPLSVTKLGILPQLDTAAKTNDHDNRKLVKKGDFAINSRSDRRGSCGISDYDGSVSLINTVLSPIGKMNPKFYNFLFHTLQFGDEFYKWGHGIVDDLWTTGWQDMKKINVPVPALGEQEKIARFLEVKCSNIDSLSANVQSQIDTLEQYKKSVITEAVTKGLDKNAEMKDSGSDIIGMTRKSFRITKFKYIATVRSNLVNPIDYQDYQQIGPDSIEKDTGKIIIKRTVEDAAVDSWNHLFYTGQILYSKIRPVLNKVCIAPFDGLCSADMYPIETYCNTRFVKYLMLSDYFVAQVDIITRDRIKMPKINQDELGEIKVCIPQSIEEQKIIGDYLDKKCSEIDTIIQEKQSQLSTLADYKKSLIYEYVTGKKEVPATEG